MLTRLPAVLCGLVSFAAATAAPAARAQALNLIAEDWIVSHEWSQPDGTKVEYDKGVIHYENRKESLASTQQRIRDGAGYVVAVTTRHVGGATDMPYGLNFGGRDYENEYFFNISADGSYRIGKFDKGRWADIKGWTKHAAIKTGYAAANRLRVDVHGTWRFYINEVLVHSMPTMDTFGRKAGVMVENPQQVDFSDFWAFEYASPPGSTDFTRKLGAIIDDLRSDFAHVKGAETTHRKTVREWAPKDPVPGLTDQHITSPLDMYVARVGEYATQADAIDAMMALRDRLYGVVTECPLLDFNDFNDKLDDLVGARREGPMSGVTLASIDDLTHATTPCSDTMVSVHLEEPSATSKKWGLSLGVFHKPPAQ